MTQELSPGAIPEPEYVPTQVEEYRDNLSVRLICHYCKEDPPNLLEDFQSGDTVCESCGYVIAARGIDTRAEWRTFANDDQNTDDPSRVGDGPNPLLNGSQLQTSIAFGDSMRSKELHRAQNKSTNDKGNKALLQGFKQINAYCEAYVMPTIVSDGAKHIFKDVDESKDFKGKSQEAIIAGCIFIACRRNGVPRSFQEIHHLTKVPKKEIGRTFKLLERFLMAQNPSKSKKPLMHANGIVALNETFKSTTTSTPAELCARFCSMLGLDQRCINMAVDLADRMTKFGVLAGRSPLSCAGACIYMASCLMGQARTPKQIEDIAKVNDSTIRNAYRSLYNEKERLIDPSWLTKGGSLDNLPKPPPS